MRLELNLNNFTYADLHIAERLPQLDALFFDYLDGHESALAVRLRNYRAGDGVSGLDDSDLLIACARHLEDFLVEAFGIEAERDALRVDALGEAVVQTFKDRFVKKCRHSGETVDDACFEQIDRRLSQALGEAMSADRERAIAHLWQQADERNDGDVLELIGTWVNAARASKLGRQLTRDWVSLAVPRRTDFSQLVTFQSSTDSPVAAVEGLQESQRRRDGFELTDARCSRREAINQVSYCKYCHDHEGDYCSRGFPAKGEKKVRTNPLGVELGGCPLNEKISEANTLERDGRALAALAVIMIDNPLVPATGHRICNDCMKSCIYQKQEPVNVPQIETRILNDVLELPWGYELYYCLTRWNPLNRERPFAAPFHGMSVLCVGVGPAGFNLSHHLLQAGFGVVAIDGLKIEPLPERWTGNAGQPPEPVRDIGLLRESLDERAMAGFGGVAEYGITVRWDKNYLRLVYLTLARHARFNVYGGIRFGGTLTIDDAWEYGFDHIALATGAGKPTIVPVKNNLAHGIRQASDFLMALQLTGAARRDSLANLQVRLPAVVVGGGLTAIDTATEVQAYYIRQVEKLLERFEVLGAESIRALVSEIEASILEEYLEHGRQVRDERERARAAGEAPDFTPLIRRWGGVTVAYRRKMAESPAYLRNHEEIEKALEEGIFYAEGVTPTEAKLDSHGHVEAMLFSRTGAGDEQGDALRLPARSVFMAAGSVPNTSYEREHQDTFEMSGRFYAAYTRDGKPMEECEGPARDRAGGAFFTSYRRGERRISFLGDNHPRYCGSVVRAMASGRDGAREIVELFRDRIDTANESAFELIERRWREMTHVLDDCLRPRIVGVRELGERLASITVRAPQATRNWRPGQVYRLQNFHAEAERREGTLLQMEGMAVDGVRVDPTRGEVSLLVNQVGTSSRIAGRLRPGEPVVLMGPTGTALPTPEDGTVTVIGGHSAVTSMLDGSHLWRASGNRTILIAHYPNGARARPMRDAIQDVADQVLWVLDSGPAMVNLRPQDACFTGGLEAFLESVGQFHGHLGAWLRDSDELIISDKPAAMATLVEALKSRLAPLLKPGVKATAVVTSPMQCMMKEVCAQCLCRHHNSQDGKSNVVFSCFNQHQPLFQVDFDNLRARQGQNSLQEKVSALWLTHVLETEEPSPLSVRESA